MRARIPELAFLGIVAMAFAASAALTVVSSLSMSSMPGMPMPWMRMPGQSWLGAGSAFIGMWIVMMIAMMLPSVLPTLRRYREQLAHARELRRASLTAVAALGYFAAWTLCGAVSFPLGVAVASTVTMSPVAARLSPLALGCTLAVAGAVQLTSWKARQLVCCRGVPGASRPPAALRAAWSFGIRYGGTCVRCCLPPTMMLMALGVMNLGAMVVVTIAITAERLAPGGARVARDRLAFDRGRIAGDLARAAGSLRISTGALSRAPEAVQNPRRMNQLQQLDQPALEWLRIRVQLACDMSEAVAELRQRGYSDSAILEAFERLRPRGNALADGAMQRVPLIRRAPPGLRRIEHPDVELYTLDNFLSRGECAKLIALIGHYLRPSTVSHDYPDTAYRTSQTADLCHLKSPVALKIDEKICKTLGIRAEYSEGCQAQRYDVGQQFKAHMDTFEPGTQTYQRLAGIRGNRTWTFMVYLNDEMEGGATRFTKLDHAVKPKTGLALFWNNLKPDGSANDLLTHCGEPVTSGHKVIITKWFRVHGDGPVFHEAS